MGTNPEETARSYGRHFDSDDELVSRITRNSIDLLKENYRVRVLVKELMNPPMCGLYLSLEIDRVRVLFCDTTTSRGLVVVVPVMLK